MEGRVHRFRAALVVVALAVTTVVAAVAPADDADAATYETRPDAGPLGAISVIGDSVLVGGLIYHVDLPDHLAARGWGPIRAYAGEGQTSGLFPVAQTFKASYWIETWRAQGWDPDSVVVNIGGNDSGWCENYSASLGYASIDDCSYASIMHLVDAIGPGKRIWWAKITRFPLQRRYQDAWNNALDRVAAELDDFHTWDWPTIMYEIDRYSPDHIHQSPDGYRERSRRMAHEITAALGRGSMTGPAADLPVARGNPVEMLPIGPTRVLDTREDPPGRLDAGQVVTVDVSDAVPPDTEAVAAYITAAAPGAPGHLTAEPCSADPDDTSFTNYTTSDRGAVTITPLTDDLTFCVRTHASTHLVIDLQAAFVPDALRFSPLTAPLRLIDTRTTGLSQHLELEVPDGAEAVAINITGVLGVAPGHVTAHPCLDEIPTAANLNHLANETIASAAIVPVSEAGTICLDTHAPVHLVVDLTGTFAADGELAFQPARPTRMLDTRVAIGGWSPLHGLGQTIEAVVAPPDAEAVTGTITLVTPLWASHLQAWGCGPQPTNSNVNAAAGATLANFVTTGADAGTLCLFAIHAGHTIFDTTGWWVS